VERLQLAHGDKILAYSDGISEAENGRNEPFEPRLHQLVKQSRQLSSQELHDRLIEDILEFHAGSKQRDDITALVLQYCGPA
jgi:serine phosphatase RsbU (regulator of sigma subunit)